MNLPTIRDYIPATGTGRMFALISLINATGTGLFLAGSAVFFVRSVGLSPTQVGLGLTVAAGVGFLATVPIGAIGDRYGIKRTLVGLLVWRAGWFVALSFVQDLTGFLIVASCLAMAEAATMPMTQAVAAATTTPADRTRTMAIIRTVRNIGFSLGALLAVPLLAADTVWTYRGLVLGNAAAFLISGLLLARLRLVQSGSVQTKVGPLKAIRGFKDWRYLLLGGYNGLLTLHQTLLTVGLPLWILQATDVPASFIPILILVNTVMTVVLQVPLSKDAGLAGRAARALRLSGFALAACALAMSQAGAPSSVLVAAGVLLAACVLLTFGEMWQAVGGWELSYAHSPEDRRGVYLSVFSLGDTGQRIGGPALITAGVMAAGPAGWIALAVVFALWALLVTPVTRMQRPVPGSDPAEVPA